jgi:hypothetical protein
MTANQAIQVLPAVNKIYGWGNAKEQQLAIKEDRCGKVISFTVTQPEIDSAGYQLTLTRIAGSENLWSMSSGEYGEVYLIDTDK